VAVALGLLSIAAVNLPLLVLHKAISRRHYSATGMIVATRILDDYLSKPTLHFPLRSLEHIAFDLLKLPQALSESPTSLMARVAAFCGRPEAAQMKIRDDPTPTVAA
jgi:hypothetical protein